MSDENEKKDPEVQPDAESEKKRISPEAEAVFANQPGGISKSSDERVDEAAETNNSKEQAGHQESAHSEKSESESTEVQPSGSVADRHHAEKSREDAQPPPDIPASHSDKKEEIHHDPQAPQKLGKETSKDRGNGRFLAFIGLGLAGLFILFILLMVLVVAKGDGASPILNAFGLDPNGIKSFLLTIVNVSFGFLSLLFFVIAIIGVFKGLFAKKDDLSGRRRGVWMTVLGVVPLVIVLFVWLFLYNLIGQIQIAAEQVKAEILVTDPTDLSGLQAPLEVTFSSENVIKSLQNKKLPITEVRWDLDGNGEYETVPNDFTISYLYQTRGFYQVGLAVYISGEEAPRTYTYPLSIREAVFEARPSGGIAPLQVQFDASQLITGDTKIKTLDWDFDEDGVYDVSGKDQLRPQHTFQSIGTFRVHLRMVDSNNVVQNYYREIEITKGDQPLISAVIDATPGLTGTAPFAIRFDGGNSQSIKGKIISYEWDFGDGSGLQSGRSVSHTFNRPGNYQVKLTVKDDIDKEVTSSVNVEIKGASAFPEAKIKTDIAPNEDGQIKGEIPFKVTFDASGSSDEDGDIVDYEWDFGDQKSGTGAKVTHTFEAAGAYSVSLTVKDSEEQEDKASIEVVVAEPGVKAVINAEPEEGTAPLNVRFDGSTSSTYEGKIVSYEWDFGDGSPKSITGARITHRYEQVGTYTARLKITTNQNESAITQKVIFVREVPLRACFTPSRTKGKAPLSVTFDAKCSTGTVQKYQWTFGDGDTSESRRPAHTFDEPGSYNVTLEVFDDKNNVSTFDEVIEVGAQ